MSEAGRTDLARMGNLLRRDVLTMVHLAGEGHPGPALSAADIVAALYFEVLRIDPAHPGWPQRDRFVLSKGHACPVVYAALARRGYFDLALLPTLRSLGSLLQGHPVMGKPPGVDMTTGSLGHGLAIGAGMGLAGRMKGLEYHVFVLMGDGELNEGLVWEAAQAAANHGLRRLIAFVDHNGYQSGGRVEEVSGIGRIASKFAAFGWHTQEIDGHDIAQILAAVEAAKRDPRPSVIVARTVKGKGVPFMEGDNSWHKRAPTKEELERAIGFLEAANG